MSKQQFITHITSEKHEDLLLSLFDKQLGGRLNLEIIEEMRLGQHFERMPSEVPRKEVIEEEEKE